MRVIAPFKIVLLATIWPHSQLSQKLPETETSVSSSGKEPKAEM